MTKALTPYQQKLLDPRWQKKRLEILSRDGFTCTRCGDPNNTLHVHHRVYEPKKEPWDYENKLLVTLCVDCHETESEYLKFAPKDLSESFLKSGFFAVDFIDIMEGLYEMEHQHTAQVVMSAYGWAFGSKKMQSKIIADYFKYLSSLTKRRDRINKNNGFIGEDTF